MILYNLEICFQTLVATLWRIHPISAQRPFMSETQVEGTNWIQAVLSFKLVALMPRIFLFNVRKIELGSQFKTQIKDITAGVKWEEISWVIIDDDYSNMVKSILFLKLPILGIKEEKLLKEDREKKKQIWLSWIHTYIGLTIRNCFSIIIMQHTVVERLWYGSVKFVGRLPSTLICGQWPNWV